MRVHEEIKKSGYFWLPANPDKKIPGTLFIKDGGEIVLEVVGVFESIEDSVIAALNYSMTLGRVIGHIESNTLVTLDDCLYKDKNIVLGGGISKSTILANKAFLGVAYGEKKPTLFKQFQFSIEGIAEWVGRSGMGVQFKEETRSVSITYNPIDEVLLTLANGMRLKITFTWSLPGAPILKEATITQQTYFQLLSDQERPLCDFIPIAYKIVTLLCFAIDNTVSIEEITVISDSLQQLIGPGKTRPQPISVYYQSLPFIKEKPNIDLYTMLFRFVHIQDYAERVFNNWLEMYDRIEPALNLYFSTKQMAYKYVEGRFLALAHALETYHRRTSDEKLMDAADFDKLTSLLIEYCPQKNREWLSGRLYYGNEINLRRRIKSIIDPFKELLGSNTSRDKLINAIVDTRNYLTHYDPSLEPRSTKGGELWGLILKMEVIFQLHLLQGVGFAQTEIKAIFDGHNGLKQKLGS